jgi:type II secretory pathway pseudopilin PulG
MHAKRSSTREAGITLIELMVAMALMTVLTGTIIFIFTQAQSIYSHVDAKVKVYQYARTALDTMETDLANVVDTCDMDFFNDGLGGQKNGHYDPGEDLNNGIGIDQTEEKQLTLPMLSPTTYHYAFTLRQPKWYTNPLFLDNFRQHSHDSIYFKTITQITGNNVTPQAQGSTVAALVEYAMVDMQKQRPKLQKRMWVLTGTDPNTGKDIINGPPVAMNTTQTTPVTQDLCLYVTDVQFQVFIKNNRLGLLPTDRFTPGNFYGAQDLVDAKVNPITGAAPFPPFRNFWGGAQFKPEGSDNYMIMCYYDPAHDGKQTDPGIFEQADNGLFHTQQNFQFPMSKPGDKIYIFDLPPGGALASAGMAANDYTIFGWVNSQVSPGTQRILFAGGGVQTTSPTFPRGGLNVAYRTGWVPPAVRVTLRIKDEMAREIRTISRTFKVLAAS